MNANLTASSTVIVAAAGSDKTKAGPDRLGQGGPPERHGPADLALDAAEVAGLLRHEYGVTDATTAATVRDLTAGWPTLVRLVGERIATAAASAADLTTLGAPGSSIATYLDKHVLSAMPPATARLLRDLAHLGDVDEKLCAAIGHRRADRSIALLADTGVLVEGKTASVRRLVPLVAEVARDRWKLTDDQQARLFETAGDWYATNGRPGDAISAYVQCGRMDSATALLLRHGPAWVVAGGAPTIAATIASLPPARRATGISLLYGEALLILGEDDRALSELTMLAEQCGNDLPPGLAWRLGAVHYLRADPHAAAAAFARGRTATGPSGCPETDAADEAMLLAWDATARWMAGDPTACGLLAHQALTRADTAGDDRARAAAHVALSMHAMLVGDRPANAAHQQHALRYATAAGDVVQAARIRVNSAARLLEEAQYRAALVEARRARDLAESAGYAAILAVAWCNEADALFRLGRLDEAADCYQQALTMFQLKGSHKVAYPLTGLGGIHRARGRHNLARAAYEEAVRVASATGDVQGMVPALAGLARVLAGTDPVAASTQATLAMRTASGPYVTDALLSMGWAQLGAGDLASAGRSAADAAAQARRHRDTSGLAEALELRAAAAAVGSPAAETRQALLEAAETWRMTEALLDVDRVVVALGGLAGASSAERVEARLARDRLEAAGVAPLTVLRWAAAHTPPSATTGVVIRALGRFEASVDGTAVTMSMWQSRKARDLLRVLVARRGRAIARDELTQLLWPGGEPDRLAHRLSVALSTVRSVLDPDRRADQDHFIIADHSGVALELDHLCIDLELFLGEATHGFALQDRGRPDDARAVLAAAERQYTGDFMENDPYEDWSVAAREEARTTYIRTVRTLAELSRSAGLVDDTVHYLLKVIDKDRYDEAGHRELVETLAVAGRHGESRRAHARYVTAMHEIGVAPSL